MNLLGKDQALLWIWAWILCSCSPIGIYGKSPTQKSSAEKTVKKNASQKSSNGNRKPGPIKPSPSPIQQFKSHSGQVCSTWGNYHFKTFDGDTYTFPGTCNYVFASHCKSNNEDFNIQIRRTVVKGIPVINQITAILKGVVLELKDNTIMMDGIMVKEIPAEKSRVHIGKLGHNIKIKVSSDISLLWNGKDSLLLKLNRKKYAKQTCGLCGDFSGVSGFKLDGKPLSPVQYGNLQKISGPTEECLDVPDFTPKYCKDKGEICKNILTSAAFSNCNTILKPMDYIDMCVQDLCQCDAKDKMRCLCGAFTEYSRQCTHAGGVPGSWRTPKMCPLSCPPNMVYQESGSPCPNTCSNTERTEVCEDHGTDGCFCTPGTVLDDINNKGCILQEDCYCVYNSETYSPGSSYSNPCRECTCASGKWKCKEFPCTGTCSVEGGSHILSFDGFRYSFNGDCSYVLVKHDDFTILADLRKCGGFSNKRSCLRNVVLALQNGTTVLAIRENGAIFLNWIQIHLPISIAKITAFWSTSFYVNIHTEFDVEVQVQLTPTMHVYVTVGPSYHGQTVGLCGNFNNIQSDDFKVTSGISEGTAASFANSWKSNSNCPNIKNSYEDPCSVNLEKEKYAQHWCGLLTSPSGPFSPCHSIENPLAFHAKCLSDTCSCKDSEECMCAALGSYAYACAKKSVTLFGWRDNVCEKYTKSCKDSQVYQYNVTRCQPTCRSRSNDDTTFNYEFSPVDGCVCREGTYLNDNGDCVDSSSCPCYYQGNAMQSGEMAEEDGIACTCERGHLTCVGAVIKEPVCPDPLAYFNCSGAQKGTKGVECQKSCHTLDMDCFSSQCISGCMCPPGLVSDGEGGCIGKEQCPCIHNEATYKPGDTILIGCNTCTCKNRLWQCTHKPCLGTCSVYGDGHYITFDGKQFTFSGSCEYILAQDNCGENGGQSSFKVITENVPCGMTNVTCSKYLKLFIAGEELLLDNEKIEVMKRDENNTIPYHVIHRGIYMVIKTDNGCILMWDKKTTMHIKLAPHFQGKVCGICGNYDGNANNDLTTRSQSVVENLIEFGNSWKTDPNCPNVHVVNDPCSINPYRKAWALRQCGIITSEVFKYCHPQVDPMTYYESCISDSCACDTGGDCECFCTTVALYAQACSEKGLCINWRTPTICPVFCDYYNDAGDCEWHYKACGDKCMKTCRNPEGECLHELSGCEGCYPKCPPSRPYFDEDNMKCVAQCGCVDNGIFYNYGDKLQRSCYSCVCAKDRIRCDYNITACQCIYENNTYYYEDAIPYSNAEDGKCSQRKCGEDGKIVTIAFNNCTAEPSPVPVLPQEYNLTTTMTTIKHTTGRMSTEQFTSRKYYNTSASTHSTTTSTKSTLLHTPSTTPIKSTGYSSSPSKTESITTSTTTVLKTTSGPSTHSTTTSTKFTVLYTPSTPKKSTSHSPSPSTKESIISSTTTVLKTKPSPSTHPTTTSTKSTLLYTPTTKKSTSHSPSPSTTESITSSTTVLKTTSGLSTHSTTTSTKSTHTPSTPKKSTSQSPSPSTTESITPRTTTVLKTTSGPSTHSTTTSTKSTHTPSTPKKSTSHSPSPSTTESITPRATTVLKTKPSPSTHPTTTSTKSTLLYTPTTKKSTSHSPSPSTTKSITSSTTVLKTTSGPSTHSTTTSTKSTPSTPKKSTSHSPSPSTTESITPRTTTVLKTKPSPSTHPTTTSTKSTLLYTPTTKKLTSHSPSPSTTESITSSTTVLKTTSGPSTHSTTTSTKSTNTPSTPKKSTSHSPSPSTAESIIPRTTIVLTTKPSPSTHPTTTSTKSTLLYTPTTKKSTSHSPNPSTTESIISSTTVLKTTSGPSTHSTTTSTKYTHTPSTPKKSTSHSPSPSTTESITPRTTTVLTTKPSPSTHPTTTSTKSTLLYTPTTKKSTSHSPSPSTTESITSSTTVLKTTSGPSTHSTTTSTKSTHTPSTPKKSTSHSPSPSTTESITPRTTIVLTTKPSPSTHPTTTSTKSTLLYTPTTKKSTSHSPNPSTTESIISSTTVLKTTSGPSTHSTTTSTKYTHTPSTPKKSTSHSPSPSTTESITPRTTTVLTTKPSPSTHPTTTSTKSTLLYTPTTKKSTSHSPSPSTTESITSSTTVLKTTSGPSTHSTTTSTKSTNTPSTPKKSTSHSPSPSTTESITPRTTTVLKTTSGPSTHSTTTSTKSTHTPSTPKKSTSHSPSPTTTESITPRTTIVLTTKPSPSTHPTTTSTKSTLLYTPTTKKSTSHSPNPSTTESIISSTTVLKTTSGPSTHSTTTSTKYTHTPSTPKKSTSHSPSPSTTESIIPRTTTVLTTKPSPSTHPTTTSTKSTLLYTPTTKKSTSHSPSPSTTESITSSTTVLKTTSGPSTHSTTTSTKSIHTPSTPKKSTSHSPSPSTIESITSSTTVLKTTSGPSTHSTTTSTKSTHTPSTPKKSTSHSPSPSTTESITPRATTVLKTKPSPSTHPTTTSTKSTLLYTPTTKKSTSHSPSPSTTESITSSTTVLKTTSGPSTHSTTTSTKSTHTPSTPKKSTSHSPSPSTTESITPRTTTVLKTTSGPSTHSTTTSTKSTHTPSTPKKSTSRSPSPSTTESITPRTTTILKTKPSPSTHPTTTSTKSTLLYTPTTKKSTSHSPSPSTTESITSSTTVLKTTSGPSTHSTTTSTKSTHTPSTPKKSTSHSPSPSTTESITPRTTTVLKTTTGPSTHSTTTSTKSTHTPSTPKKSTSHSPSPSTTESILLSTTKVWKTTPGQSPKPITASTKSILFYTPTTKESTSHSPSPSTTESITPRTTTVLKTTTGPSTHSTTTSTKSTHTPSTPKTSTSHSPSPSTTKSITPRTTTVLKTTSGPSTYSTTKSTKSTHTPSTPKKSTSYSPSPSTTESITPRTTTVLKTTTGPSTHSTTTSTKSTYTPSTPKKSTSHSSSPSTTESITPRTTTVLKTTTGPSTHSTTTSTKSSHTPSTPKKSTSHSPSPSTTESITPRTTTVLKTTSGPSTHSTTVSTKSTHTPSTPKTSTSHSPSPSTKESITPRTTTVLQTTSGPSTHPTTTSTKSTLLSTPTSKKSASHSPMPSTTELITLSTTTVLEHTTGPSTHFTIFTKPEMSYTSPKTLSTSPTVQCHWTDWFDMNHPTSDNDGGDEENYEIAKNRGFYVCSNKTFIKDIKCRASSYPDISIENLPQKVTCNIETGLLCRNQDNPGPLNMCLNYEAKFCCGEIITTTSTSPRSTSALTFSISTTVSTERPHFCVYKGYRYKVGSSVPKNPESCEECQCTQEKNIAKVTCKIKACQTNCSLGFTYKPEPTKCCGKCVRNTCVLEAAEIIKGYSIGDSVEQCCHSCSQDVCAINNTVLIKPGKHWNPPGDKCTFYDCDANKLTVIRRVMSCPVQKNLTCPEGIMVNFTSADGCCTMQYCEPRKCDVMKSWEVIKSNGCTANVMLTNCGGYCSSMSRHPSFPKMVKHDCTCCQPINTTMKKVQLLCETGRKIAYNYTDVVQCACRKADCVFIE
ncbi:mucin-5AC-like [Bufo gargarizans]|uniref:mucin-5AC-like n=1 Tax=Bufo gargarizans TaxID=30331 RepID=UPI001CF5B2D2|nr:mucin-5AC-like [Bufo gargarizans]